MKAIRSIGAAALMTAATLASAAPQARPFGTAMKNNLVFVVNGATSPNTQPSPPAPEFYAWCANTCHPSTQMSLYDAKTGDIKGNVYTWTLPFEFSADGKSFCFSEFVQFDLPDGSIYAHSGSRGTCGAFIDPELKMGTHAGEGSMVVGAGGDGIVVGGTFRYRNWTGTYTDRLFSELSADGGGYYDQLFWSISAHERYRD